MLSRICEQTGFAGWLDKVKKRDSFFIQQGAYS